MIRPNALRVRGTTHRQVGPSRQCRPDRKHHTTSHLAAAAAATHHECFALVSISNYNVGTQSRLERNPSGGATCKPGAHRKLAGHTDSKIANRRVPPWRHGGVVGSRRVALSPAGHGTA